MTNTSSFCIDLLFTLNLSLITEFGMNNLIIRIVATVVFFGKMNLNVSLPPLHVYTCEV